METFKTRLLFWIDKEKKAIRKIIFLWVVTLFYIFLTTLKVFGLMPEVPWVIFPTIIPMAIFIHLMSLKDEINHFYKININKYK